jgi:hypothetical protein
VYGIDQHAATGCCCRLNATAVTRMPGTTAWCFGLQGKCAPPRSNDFTTHGGRVGRRAAGSLSVPDGSPSQTYLKFPA